MVQSKPEEVNHKATHIPVGVVDARKHGYEVENNVAIVGSPVGNHPRESFAHQI